MNMLKKEDIVAETAEELGTTKKDARKHLECAMRIVSNALSDGYAVEFSGIGRLVVTETAPRTWNNPVNGQKVYIPKHRKVKLIVSSSFKKQLNFCEDENSD